ARLTIQKVRRVKRCRSGTRIFLHSRARDRTAKLFRRLALLIAAVLLLRSGQSIDNADLMTAPHPEFVAALEKGMTVAFWAKRQPHASAVVAATGNRTYGELNARSNQIVRALRAHGVGAGDGVALLCANRTEFVEMFWATRRAGIRLTPVNWRLTGEEAAYIVNDCDAKAFIADTRFQGVAERVATNAPAAALRIAIGGALPGFDSYEAFVRDHDGSDIADPQMGNAMLYTSGTTGKPKGVYRSSAPPP